MKKIAINATIITTIIFTLALLVGFTAINRVNLAKAEGVQILEAEPILGSFVTPFATYTSQSGVLVTTASTQVVATSTARTFLRVTNISSNNIYCSDGTQNAVLYEGVAIMASSSVEFSSNTQPFTGALNCISTGNASTTVIAK